MPIKIYNAIWIGLWKHMPRGRIVLDKFWTDQCPLFLYRFFPIIFWHRILYHIAYCIISASHCFTYQCRRSLHQICLNFLFYHLLDLYYKVLKKKKTKNNSFFNCLTGSTKITGSVPVFHGIIKWLERSAKAEIQRLHITDLFTLKNKNSFYLSQILITITGNLQLLTRIMTRIKI